MIDAVALRLYPGSGPAVRTRADAIIGFSPKGKYGLYYMARHHYVADGDVKDASASATHYTSAILGILVPF